ncbi:VOC family protein [Klenkia soli]|nr:VOC family protein [Klenkia soli]
MTSPARFKDLCIDARDHQALADWWCAAMGYVRRDDLEPADDGWVRPRDWPVPITDPAGRAPLIWVVPVSDPKVVKNRMHLDVVGDTAALVTLGATVVRGKDGDDVDPETGGIEWDVLADPEGNEFCCFAPSEPSPTA